MECAYAPQTVQENAMESQMDVEGIVKLVLLDISVKAGYVYVNRVAQENNAEMMDAEEVAGVVLEMVLNARVISVCG